eukprot:jgi/Chrzof1/8423/Cz03g10050.t1
MVQIRKEPISVAGPTSRSVTLRCQCLAFASIPDGQTQPYHQTIPSNNSTVSSQVQYLIRIIPGVSSRSARRNCHQPNFAEQATRPQT